MRLRDLDGATAVILQHTSTSVNLLARMKGGQLVHIQEYPEYSVAYIAAEQVAQALGGLRIEEDL